MKKYTFLSILLFVILALSSCGSGDDSRENPETNNNTVPTDINNAPETNNTPGRTWVKCNWCGGHATETCSRCQGIGSCTYKSTDGVIRCTNGIIKCSACSGTGNKPGIIFNHTAATRCSSCNGKGTWTCTICDESGFCSTCHGSGKISCHECNGLGGHYE